MDKAYSTYSRVELNEINKSLEDSWSFETRAILKSQAADPATGSTIFPIYQTSTYTQRGIDDNKGYVYSRSGNPNRSAVADVIASLESAKDAFVYPSGISAIHAVMQQLKAGDHIISGSDLYGGAHRLFEQIFSPLGLEYTYVDTREPANILNAIKSNTRLIWLESPSNPLMRLCDISLISQSIAKYNADHGLTDLGLPIYPGSSRTETKAPKRILIGFDNTFASPYLQRPLELGVDIVVHSATKYLGGHSDVLIGAVVVRDPEIAEVFKYHQNATGCIAGPFDSWILMKGIKTLAVRMKQHHENCMLVAEYLSKHPKVESLYCPALVSNPQYELYKRQMSLYNGMLAFEFAGDFNKVKEIVSKAKLFQLAESLGGVESLIGHPASMTHAAVPKARRLELGINDNLIRLSIGIENVRDIINDLEQMMS